MKKIISFALLDFIKGTREKIFWGILFLFVILLGLSLFLSILSVGENQRIMINAGLSAIEISGALLLIIGLSFSFYGDRNERMLEIYLSYFARQVYTASKFLAYILLTISYLIISALLFTLVLMLNYNFAWQIFAGIYSVALKLFLVIGINLFFCCLVDSPVIAVFSTIFIYGASQIAGGALTIISISKNSILEALFKFLFYLLPNMNALDIKYEVMYMRLPSAAYFASISLYALIYCLFLWTLSTLAFSRK